MKNIFIICAFLLVFVICAVLASIYWSIVIQPRAQSNLYKTEWVNSFMQYSQGAVIPTKWTHKVYSRNLNNHEWILAAMHHGSCCEQGRESFDATVFLDSRGTITTCDWSPCASPLDIGTFWKELVPASDLMEFYKNQNRHAVLTVVGTNNYIEQAVPGYAAQGASSPEP